MSNFITNKQDGVSTLGADEWNQIAEINNLILSSGQSLDVNLTDQIAKAIANYTNSGNFYTENGVANSYTLIGAGSFKTPTAYINGMVVRFITTNANTTTTPTINVAGLGAKNIKKADGTVVIAGDINGYVELRYNGTDFLLSPLSSALNITTTNKGLTYLNNPITIANNSTDADNDIDFSAGNFQFADGSGQAVLSALTKRLDASWTAGTNQGGLDTGTKANSTWYHCYAIHNPTSGVSDAIFSTNATNPTLPTGYTKYKYQGSVLTNVSGNIIGFWQENHSFYFKVDNGIVNTTTPVSTLTNLTLSAPPNSKAITTSYINIGPSVGTGLYFKDIVNNTSYPVNVSENDTTSQNIFEIRVNNSSQIQYYLTVTSLQDFTISTIGYINLNI